MPVIYYINGEPIDERCIDDDTCDDWLEGLGRLELDKKDYVPGGITAIERSLRRTLVPHQNSN